MSQATGWHKCLGVDLGYEDATAFTLGAYHDHSPVLYLMESWKRTKMDLTDVASAIKKFQAEHEIDRVVVDGSAKQAVAEMQRRHGVSLTPADKRGKADFIQLMSDEFMQARIKLSPACQALKDEYATLIWDDRSDTPKEHASCENHCTDSALYLWRHCYQYMSSPEPKAPEKPGTAAWHEEQARRMAAEATSMREAAIEEQLEKQRAREEQNEWGF